MVLTISEARDTVSRTLILRVLEAQLPQLDELGAHLAAAHVDAAINQLRRDIAQISD